MKACRQLGQREPSRQSPYRTLVTSDARSRLRIISHETWICDISSGTKRNHTSLRNRRIEFMVNDRFQSLLRQPRFVQRKCEDREVTIEFSKQGIYGPLAIMFAFLGCVGVAVSLFN